MASFALKQSPIRAWSSASITLASVLALLLATGVHADFLRCIDANGKTIYTDSRALCPNDEAKFLNIDLRAKSSSANKGKVDYRISSRQYELVCSSYTVFIEHDLLVGDTSHAKAGSNTNGNIFCIAASVCTKVSPIDVLYYVG